MEFSFILKGVSYMITQGFPVYSCLITQSPRVESSAFCHSVTHSPGPGTPHCKRRNRYTGRDTEQSTIADVHMRLQVMLASPQESRTHPNGACSEKHIQGSTCGKTLSVKHTQRSTLSEAHAVKHTR